MAAGSRFYEGSPEELTGISVRPLVSPTKSDVSASSTDLRSRALSTSSTNTVSSDDATYRARSSSLASTSTLSVAGQVSSKRQEEFEKAFGAKLKAELDGEIPDEYLTVIETQSGDLQAKVLLHGRLYLTKYHLCFRSNILGYKTERIHSLKHITGVEKGTTAKWIQNAVYILVDDNAEEPQVGYGSLADRDSMHASITECWKALAPENYEAMVTMHKAQKEEKTIMEETADVMKDDGDGDKDRDDAATTHAAESPARSTKDSGERFKELALDTTYPITLDQLFNLIYHNDKFINAFYKSQKLTNIEISGWKEEDGKKVRRFTSVMHMSNPIGPSKSASNGTETIQIEDPEKSYEVLSETSTPDVPSGKSFTVQTRSCLTHAKLNGRPAAQLFCTTECNWSSSSWLKSTITPAVIKGQKEYHHKLDVAIRAWIKDHPDDFQQASSADRSAAGTSPASSSDDDLASADKEKSAGGTRDASILDDDTDVAATTKPVDTAEPDDQPNLFDHAMQIPSNPVMLGITLLCLLLLSTHVYSFVYGGPAKSVHGHPHGKELLHVMEKLAAMEKRFEEAVVKAARG